VREAQRLLEATALGIEDIGMRCGFGGAIGLRQHFGRVVGTSPTAYRRAFSAAAAAS
jgi:transcriptional regulator GlxA family with amidase domain